MGLHGYEWLVLAHRTAGDRIVVLQNLDLGLSTRITVKPHHHQCQTICLTKY
jgi:hypothetical protein